MIWRQVVHHASWKQRHVRIIRANDEPSTMYSMFFIAYWSWCSIFKLWFFSCFFFVSWKTWTLWFRNVLRSNIVFITVKRRSKHFPNWRKHMGTNVWPNRRCWNGMQYLWKTRVWYLCIWCQVVGFVHRLQKWT